MNPEVPQEKLAEKNSAARDVYPGAPGNGLIGCLVSLCLASRYAFWKLILGSRCSLKRNVRIYEGVKLAVEAGGQLRGGDGVTLQQGVVISVKPGGQLELGDKVYVGEYCVLMVQTSILVGRETMIGPHCTIVDYNHCFRSAHEKMQPEKIETKPIMIGDNVWIGAGCQILAGVKIGGGAVIGAGSTVVRDIPALAVAAGSPAKVLRFRQ